MSVILYIIYLAGLTFALCRTGFVKRSGLSWKWISGLFLAKAAAGLAVGYISYKYYPQGNDYWNLHRDGISEFHLFKDSPGEFIRSLFVSPYGHYGNFFGATNSYWNDLESNLVIKTLGILNFLGRENYYLNSLFFSFIGFFGHVALYRTFRKYTEGKNLLLIAACFLIPTTLYFSSGIHKDCIVFTLTGLIIYGYSEYERVGKKLWIVILSLLLMFLLRNYLALIITGLLILLFVTKKLKWPGWTLIPVAAAGVLLLSFTPLDPFKMLAARQDAFLNLPVANSQIELTRLEPGPSGFIKNFPEALSHGFLRPYPGEFKSLFLNFAAIELYILLIYVFVVLLSRFKLIKHNRLTLFCLCLAVIMIIMAGYIVPNAGTLVRYRSLYLSLLIIPILLGSRNADDAENADSREKDL